MTRMISFGALVKPALVLAVALAGVASLGFACYFLSKTTYPGGGQPGAVVSVRKGEVLTTSEKKGVQAAIDLLKRWETNCGVVGDTPAGSLPVPKPSDQLQGLMDSGSICREVAADPKSVGATSSTPHTGNGVEDSPGTQSGGGSRWDTSGHPGINITPPNIPSPTPGGGFSSGGETFDTTAVANLAGNLLHETSHLTNPNNSANSAGEYEAPAYTYTAKELCKVAGCATEPPEVKRAVCKLIIDCNRQLCKFGKPQQDCPACASLNPPIITTVPCPPPSPPSGGGSSGLVLYYQQVLSAAAVPIQPVSMPEMDRELYAAGNLRGSIWLDRVSQDLTISIASSTVSFDYVFHPTAYAGLNFVPLSFTQTGRSAILLAGFDSVTLEGKLVQVQFDVTSGTIAPPTVIYTGPAFTRPSSIARLPGVPSIAIVDSNGPKVLVHELRSGVTSLVASATTYPQLANKPYVVAYMHSDPTSTLSGIALLVSSDPAGQASGPLSQTVSLFDFDGDGSFDLIQ